MKYPDAWRIEKVGTDAAGLIRGDDVQRIDDILSYITGYIRKTDEP